MLNSVRNKLGACRPSPHFNLLIHYEPLSNNCNQLCIGFRLWVHNRDQFVDHTRVSKLRRPKRHFITFYVCNITLIIIVWFQILFSVEQLNNKICHADKYSGISCHLGTYKLTDVSDAWTWSICTKLDTVIIQKTTNFMFTDVKK